MFDTAFGLPLHPLVVHLVVVFLPLASLAVLLAAVWPTFRRWAGPLPLAIAVIGAVFTWVATESGEALAGTGLNQLPLVQTHMGLGSTMKWWALGLLVPAALVFWLYLKTRSADSNRKPSQALVAGIAVLAAAAAVGTVVHVYRVGESGARAVYDGVTFSSQG
jgi:uncharacterized membrane protein